MVSTIRGWKLDDVALFFLAPLLAIAVWFLLYHGGPTSPQAIAVLSSTIGLITDEIIQALIRFTKSAFKNQEEKEEHSPMAKVS
jgi:hypothetical protein